MSATLATTIGNNIRVLRLRHGLTQADLAEEIGVSRTAVTNWETNRASPPITKLSKLGKALNVHPAALLQVNNSDRLNQPVAHPLPFDEM